MVCGVLDEYSFIGFLFLLIGVLATIRIVSRWRHRSESMPNMALPSVEIEGSMPVEGVEGAEGVDDEGALSREPSSILNVVDLLVVVVVFGFLLLSWASVGLVDGPRETELTSEVVLATIMMQLFFMGLPVLMVMARQSPVAFFGLKRGLKLETLAWAVLAYVSTIIVVILLSVAQYETLIQWLFVGAEKQESIQELQESGSAAVYLKVILMAVIMAPIGEEFLYRGYLNPVMERFCGKHFAIILMGLLFAVCHGKVYPLLPLFVFGIILGYLYDQTKTIWAPILCHALFNGTTVLMTYLSQTYDLPI